MSKLSLKVEDIKVAPEIDFEQLMDEDGHILAGSLNIPVSDGIQVKQQKITDIKTIKTEAFEGQETTELQELTVEHEQVVVTPEQKILEVIMAELPSGESAIYLDDMIEKTKPQIKVSEVTKETPVQKPDVEYTPAAPVQAKSRQVQMPLNLHQVDTKQDKAVETRPVENGVAKESKIQFDVKNDSEVKTEVKGVPDVKVIDKPEAKTHVKPVLEKVEAVKVDTPEKTVVERAKKDIPPVRVMIAPKVEQESDVRVAKHTSVPDEKPVLENAKAAPEIKLADEFVKEQKEPIKTIVTAQPKEAISVSAQTESKVEATKDMPQVRHTPEVKKQVFEQVGTQVKQSLQQGQDKMTVRLSPPSLGKIEIEMTFGKDGKMAVSFVVDKPETFDLLQRNPTQLRATLAEAGFTADQSDLSFNLKDEAHERQAQNKRNYKNKQESDEGAVIETVRPDYRINQILDTTKRVDIHA